MIKKIRKLGAIFKYWGYDIRRFSKNLNYRYANNTVDKFKGALTMNYHVVEKGLTMPETRLGFGENQILTMIALLESYNQKGFSKKEYEYVYCLKILNEYLDFHNTKNYELKSSLVTKIKNLLELNKVTESSSQHNFDREEYFKFRESSFESFALSRYSVRNYSDKRIPKEVIKSCIRVAMKSPSSCNRQPVRVFAVQDSSKKQAVLKLQSGNRGFGHLADTIFVICTKISFFQNFAERHELAVNAGLFSMSLLYSLHQNEILGCPLNWSVDPKRDKTLKDLLGVDDDYMINMLISAGYAPENFSVAYSPRENINNILTYL